MEVPSSRYIVGNIPWYGALIASGMILAVLIAIRGEKKAGLPRDTIIDLALWLLPVGILGARLYYVLFSLDSYRTNLISIFHIWEGGLAIYGGLISGGLTVFFFCRKRKIPVLKVLDIIVPGVALAQSIGRWGNYFNQEAYGIMIVNPNLQFFPLSVLISEKGVPVWHLATFFLESILDFGIFCFLILGQRRLFKKEGDAFLTYGLLYAAGRFVVEDFRMDSLYAGSQIRISQLISVLVCIAVLFIFLIRRFRNQHNHLTVIQWSFGIACILYAISAVFYCLGLFLQTDRGTIHHIAYLTVFFMMMITTFIFLYGRTDSAEVLYANH